MKNRKNQISEKKFFNALFLVIRHRELTAGGIFPQMKICFQTFLSLWHIYALKRKASSVKLLDAIKLNIKKYI